MEDQGLVNANEFIKWLGSELQTLIQTTNELNRFSTSKDLVDRAINYLIELPPVDRSRVLDALITSYELRKIGDFQVPYDIRNEFDTIEAIYATIKAFLEG